MACSMFKVRMLQLNDIKLQNVILLNILFIHRFHSLVPVAGYLLPSLSIPESTPVTIPHEETSLYPDPDFDLNKFNECVAERRAVLDHQNKDIAVSTPYNSSVYL